MTLTRKRKFSLLLVGLGLLSVGYFVFRPGEPSYKGKTVTAWLDDATPGQPLEAAYEAFGKIGTNAIPYTVRWLIHNDSFWPRKYREIWPFLPPRLQRLFHKPVRHSDGFSESLIFVRIGPASIPYAIALLKHPNPKIRSFAASGLGDVWNNSSTDARIIPALIAAADDPAERVRFMAILALGRIGPGASNAIPTLIQALALPGTGLQTNTPDFQRLTVQSLGLIGPAATNALPTLTQLLQNPDSRLRGTVAVAMWRISSNADTALPVLLAEMPRVQEMDKWDWTFTLSTMGPRAKAAFPQLTNEWSKSKNPMYRQILTDALVSIDPEAAAQLGVKPAMGK